MINKIIITILIMLIASIMLIIALMPILLIDYFFGNIAVFIYIFLCGFISVYNLIK